MAKRKIRLTYLWADESVMAYDFARKLSEGMTWWGNEFYDRYGFEFNVAPGPLLRRSVTQASKYALAKNDGVIPDLRDRDVILEEQNKVIAEIKKRLEAKDQEILASFDQWGAEIRRVRPDASGGIDAGLARAKRNHEARLARLNREREPIAAEEAAARDRADRIVDRATGETMLRLQMALAHHAHKVGSDDRVNIVFCRFRQLAMRSRDHTFGMAFVSIRPLMWFNRALWPYPFIIVNVIEAPPETVAHEIVHIAGQSHPTQSIEVFEKISKRLVTAKLPRGSLGGGAPFTDLEFEYDTRKTKTIPGGYFDGDVNDIMNYSLNDPGPGDCILNGTDLARMKAAWFVSP